MRDAIKVLYIAGPTRSGSTLLSNTLGEVDGFFNAGEVIDVWDRGLLEDGRCGCGRPVRTCDLWHQVLDAAFGDLDETDLHAMVHMRDLAAHSHRVPWLLWAPGAASKLRAQLGDYIDGLGKLYAAIRTVTQCDVVVDASKNLGYAFVLAMVPDVEVHLAHVIRDPRATAYSWRRKKEGLRQDHPFQNALVWNSRNAVAELLGTRWRQSYQRVFYEDFVREPRNTVSRLMHQLGKDAADLRFIADREISLGVNHSVYGNPNRFDGGRVRLRLDDEWRTGISTADHLLTTAMTLPLLVRYRYGLGTGRRR